MAFNRPFRRTFRQLADGSYTHSGNGRYMDHPKYLHGTHTDSPAHYVRAYLLLQKDLLELFDYVEPADANQTTYSFRIHELHMRTCMEIEAHCKAILSVHGYVPTGRWNITDYRKLNATHRLSDFEVKMPHWSGNDHTRTPFAAWSSVGSPIWWNDYNTVKHDRHGEFIRANLSNLMGATCGLVAVLASQFGADDFSAGADLLALQGSRDDFEDAIGAVFRVKYPEWPLNERYDFEWETMRQDADPFQTHTYPP